MYFDFSSVLICFRGSVARTCSAVPGSRHPSVGADSAGLVATSFLKNRSDRVHSFAGNSWSIAPTSGPRWMCATRGAGDATPSCTISTQLHQSLTKRQKAKTRGKKEVTKISQRTTQIVEGVCTKESEDGGMSEMRPRTSDLQHRFGTDSALPWMESRRNTVQIDQSVPKRSRRPWRVAEYQPYRRWKVNDWFWWPMNTPKTRRWHTGSTSHKRLDGPGASFGGKPSLCTGTIR